MQLLLAVLAWGSSALAADFQPLTQSSPALRIKTSKESVFTEKKLLLDDLQMPTVVTADNATSYVYFHEAHGPFTLIIRPCSSSINVTISHIAQNDTGLLNDYIKGRSENMAQSKGMRPHVFSWSESPAGLYLLTMVAENRDTIVTLFATKLANVPPVMLIKQRPRVRIQPRLRRNRVTVRWDQSVVDPQLMNYYVVINSRKNFTSLCEAYVIPDMDIHVMSLRSSKMENIIHKRMTEDAADIPPQKKTRTPTLGEDDVFVIFVGSGTSYTVSNLQKGRKYFFQIFAENNYTKLSFLYASKSMVYDPKVRPVGLKDNKPMTVNIRRLGGKASFRYKVGKLYGYGAGAALSWHVMPCGAPVQVEVTLRRQVVVARQTVEGYAHLQVPHPKPGQRFVLHVYVTEPEHMRLILGVEVLATMRMSLLPELPSELSVYEYTSLRTCDSVTIGWVPVPGQSVRYCMSASPVSFVDLRGHFRPQPNQCNLDYRLNHRFDFAVRQCHDFSANDNRLVLTETITKLLPAKEYLIQVTVKKIKGQALSYDLLRVRTNSEC